MRRVVGYAEDAHDTPVASNIRRVPAEQARFNPDTPMHAGTINAAETKEEYVMSEIEWIVGREYETRAIGVVRYIARLSTKSPYKHHVVQVNAPYKWYCVDKNGRYEEDESMRDLHRGPDQVSPRVEG